jgi:hypothetical protein
MDKLKAFFASRSRKEIIFGLFILIIIIAALSRA